MAKDLPSVRRFLDNVSKNVMGRRSMQTLGVMGKDIIFKRTKIGFGVDSETRKDPRKKRLKRLSTSYKAQRREDGVQGSFGSPGRSNLTNTGDMLDSFVVTAKVGQFTIMIPNSRRKDGKINAQIARFVSQQGRPFFAITKDERQILIKEVQNRIRKSFVRAV